MMENQRNDWKEARLTLSLSLACVCVCVCVFSTLTDRYGVMMYHNNRLITPYVRVGMQLEANAKGVGVLGICDADFLVPTHNKQSFADSPAYRNLLKKLAQTLNVFWWDKVESQQQAEGSLAPKRRPAKKTVPDVLWVQCEYVLLSILHSPPPTQTRSTPPFSPSLHSAKVVN